jgi:hypothetical protein
MRIDAGEMAWHNDGHALHLQIDGSEIRIVRVDCPARGNELAPCHVRRVGCLVEEFAFRYGLECNAGSCLGTDRMQICWTKTGHDEDLDLMQVWFMPINDEVFGAWLQFQKEQDPPQVP